MNAHGTWPGKDKEVGVVGEMGREGGFIVLVGVGVRVSIEKHGSPIYTEIKEGEGSLRGCMLKWMTLVVELGLRPE